MHDGDRGAPELSDPYAPPTADLDSPGPGDAWLTCSRLLVTAGRTWRQSFWVADEVGTTLLNLRGEGLVGARFRACYGESEVDSGFRFEHRAGLLRRSTTVLRGDGKDLCATWKRAPFGRWRLREASTPEWLELRIRRRFFGATWIQRPDGVPVAAIRARRLGLTAELEVLEPTLPRWVALAALLSHLLAGS